MTQRLAEFLEDCYAQYNVRACRDSDPVSFVHEHDDPLEREVIGLVAACLAYGKLSSILASVGRALERLENRPRSFLLSRSEAEIRLACESFRHRFTGGEALARLLCGVRRVLKRRGSLRACFLAHDGASSLTVLPAAGAFVAEVAGSPEGIPHLLPSPAGGSACKRLCLYLRWMVRCDEIDPGGWDSVGPARLLVPLDTHMTRVCHALGFTRRESSPDMRTAREVTEAFRRIRPDDPARYDFSLMHASAEGGPDFPACLRRAAGA